MKIRRSSLTGLKNAKMVFMFLYKKEQALLGITRLLNVFNRKHLTLKKSSEVMYTDEPGVYVIGYIEIPLADINTIGIKRFAEFTMSFGDTEIKVTAKEKNVTSESITWGKVQNLAINNHCDAWCSKVVRANEQLSSSESSSVSSDDINIAF